MRTSRFLVCLLAVASIAGCDESSEPTSDLSAPAGIPDESSKPLPEPESPGTETDPPTEGEVEEPEVVEGPGRISTAETSGLLRANPEIACEFTNGVDIARERWSDLVEIPVVVGDDRDPLFPGARGSIELANRSGEVQTVSLESLTPRWLWRAARVSAEYIGFFSSLDGDIPPYIVIRPSTLIAREKYATGELVMHEMGHAVSFAIIERRYPESMGSPELERRAHRQLLAEYGITPDDAAGVSDYATTSPVEAFAEVYMHFFNRINSFDPNLGRKFEALLSAELPEHSQTPRFVRLRPDKPLVCPAS